MNMDLSLIIGLIGLLIGIYPIYLVLKKKKYPGIITIIKENSIGLFNEIANNFDEIKIEFNNNPISQNVIYIKASIINNGDIDLNFNNSEIPFGLELGEKLIWTKANIINTSPNVSCETEIKTSNLLNFKCGYLKIGEFIQFEALIETDNTSHNSTNIFKKIQPIHRLLNTRKIEFSDYLGKEEWSKSNIGWKMSMVFLAIILFANASFAYLEYKKNGAKIHYKNSEQFYDITPLQNNLIKLSDIHTSKENIISISEFQKEYLPVITHVDYWEKFNKYLLIFGPVCILFIIMQLYHYLKNKEKLQFSKILENRKN